jgi:hypothetical protein
LHEAYKGSIKHHLIMRTKKAALLLPLLCSLWLLFAMSSCTHKSTPQRHPHPHGLPPGQAKKLTGSKSAKPYAPGQQKKHKHKHKH